MSLKALDYLTIDLNDPSVTMKGDITNLDLANNSVDVIICYHVLEHVVQDRRAMREIYRVLRSGGWALLQVPIDRSVQRTYEDTSITSPEDRLRHFGQEDHVRIYGRDYQDRLTESGFCVTIVDLVKRVGDDGLRRYGLDPNELIYRCDKPHDIRSNVPTVTASDLRRTMEARGTIDG
jgi:predicted SAM-dependent methyltransferase